MKHVLVRGGREEVSEVGEGKAKKTIYTFHEKVRVVVREEDVGALFRRDHELAGMDIRMCDTNLALTPGYFFSPQGTK